MVSFLYSLHMYSDLGVLALRLAIGVIFLYHCKTKVGGKQGNFMTLVGYVELLGGLSVLLGLATQVGAGALAVIMIGATYKKIKEWHVPFSAMDKMGWEFDVALLGGCLTLMTLGGGMYALDPAMLGL